MKTRTRIIRVGTVVTSAALVAAYIGCRTTGRTEDTNNPQTPVFNGTKSAVLAPPPEVFPGSKSAPIVPAQPRQQDR